MRERRHGLVARYWLSSFWAKAFFDDLRRNPRCSGNTIRSYLIMPVQRIPRYRLLAMVRWFRRFHVLCGRM